MIIWSLLDVISIYVWHEFQVNSEWSQSVTGIDLITRNFMLSRKLKGFSCSAIMLSASHALSYHVSSANQVSGVLVRTNYQGLNCIRGSFEKSSEQVVRNSLMENRSEWILPNAPSVRLPHIYMASPAEPTNRRMMPLPTAQVDILTTWTQQWEYRQKRSNKLPNKQKSWVMLLSQYKI